MLVGLSGLTATPAAAVEDTGHVPLPVTGYAAEVVAASGTGIIMAKAGEDGAYQVSVDSGQTFTDLSAPAFTGQVSYVGAGKVLYVDPTGDTDATGDFLNLYTYDLGTATTTAAPVKVYAAEVKAVTPEHAVVANEATTGYSAVPLAGGSSNLLDVPDHAGVPAFTLSTGATALAATVARDGAGVLGAGFLDAVPLSGELSTSVPAPGLAAARLSDSSAYWVTGDASGATLCSAPVATLASPACHTLASGDYSHARASLEAGPGWVVARLRSDSGNAAVEYVYLSGPDTVATVSPASGMVSVSVYGRGDTETPLATVLTTDGGYVGTYAAGAVTSLFDLPEVPATTSALFVTPRTISGLDDRPALGISGQQAWTRPLDGVDLGNEQLLSPRATGLAVSGDRTLVTTASGAELLEPDRPALSLSGVSNGRSLSGPYFLSGSTADPAVMRVDGVPVPNAGPVVALFGSLALRTAGTGYEVVDVDHPATVVAVDLAAHCPGDSFEATAIWGDWVLAETDSGDTVVLNYRHPANCYAHKGAPLALGDGFALVAPIDPDTDNPDLVAWNFLHGASAVVAKNPSAVATDGSHKVAWTTSTQLRTSTLDDLVTPSAPRVLGVVADPLVAIGSPWTLILDASKGLKDAGSGLAITNSAGDVVRRVDVPEASNGSVRVTWDGNIDGSPAPAGDYGWKLNLMSSDNAGFLVSTDGTSAVTGTVTVTGTLPSVGGVAATLSPATPVTGSPVTAQTGGWTPAGATFTYQWYLDSVALYGEVHPTYTPAHDDQGKELSVAVTGSAPAHTPLTLTSAQTKVAWPSVTGATPQLSMKTPMVGTSISVDPGTWAPAGRALAYQWYRDAQAIGGATLPTYTALSADVGHRLKVAVTGSAFEHADLTRTSLESEAVARLPVTAGQPTLSVTSPVVGRSITAIPGTWSPSGVSFAYQWYRDAGAIGGATLATYVPVVGDFGHTLKVEVTGYAPERAPVTRTSASSAAVVTATFVPTVPVLSTTSPAVEQTVTAKTGTWGTSVVTFGYQWYRVSSKGKSRAIGGATHGDYRVPAKDIGYKLKVKVTGSGAGVGSASLYSKLSAKVKKATFATAAAPTITGTAQVGHALRANPGTYSPQAAFKYQWYRGRKAIKRATSATYLLKAADKGKVMTVRVTATRAGYVTTVKSAKLATKVA